MVLFNRHPTRSQPVLIYRGLKIYQSVSALCVCVCVKHDAAVRAVSFQALLLEWGEYTCFNLDPDMCKNITVSSKFGHLYSHVKHTDLRKSNNVWMETSGENLSQVKRTFQIKISINPPTFMLLLSTLPESNCYLFLIIFPPFNPPALEYICSVFQV